MDTFGHIQGIKGVQVMSKNLRLETKIILSLSAVVVITLAIGMAGLTGLSLVGAAVFAVASALLAGVWLSRGISAVINAQLAEARRLVKAVKRGKLDARGDAQKVGFEFSEIVEETNEILDTVVSYIDVLPVPVMMLDRDFTIQYISRAGLDLLGLPAQQVIGTKCYNHFKTADCNTANCACAMAMGQGEKVTRETTAWLRGLELEISCTGIPVKDADGKVTGAIGFVEDKTEVKRVQRVMEKRAAYQEQEVLKLAVNLDRLARGDLNLETTVAPTDEDTRAIGESFAQINNSLAETVGYIKLMLDEVNGLAAAVVEGRLDTRADSSKHSGEYGAVIEGVNRVLDAVTGPINEAAACLKEMAEGKLDVAMIGAYEGDHAIIKEALNATLDAINEILGQVIITIDQVASSSEQVSDASQVLAQGASESAASIQEVNASLQQISAQTKQNAENSAQANQLALQARASAERGSEQMAEMVRAMNDISESATDIAKIIKAIDEIAFQTNLLALNAAVEAARAGKHGKGFAVVAEEVRNLAERSARAARETAEMIEGSIKKTEAGTRIVEGTSQALEEIVLGVTKVTDLIGEIAAASKEQALAVDQIHQGLDQVSQVIQQNTASSEESAAASEELSAQAQQLRQMVAKFRLRDTRAEGQTWQTAPGCPLGAREAAAAFAEGVPAKDAKRPPEVIPLDDAEFGRF
ncbi:MAG TPA: methyl-accepting chemotaxis protein [Desulfotomaculum sp.]|nr:methyl-accepting chemotaxis protein [Desulfotomaculum sp.]